MKALIVMSLVGISVLTLGVHSLVDFLRYGDPLRLLIAAAGGYGSALTLAVTASAATAGMVRQNQEAQR